MYDPDELSDYEVEEITEEKISDINESEELELERLEELMSEKKPQIYRSDKPYSFTEDKERADVYIKNYLMKFDMEKSLKILEQEFFELLSKGEIRIEEIPNVPAVYIQSEKYQESIGNIQKELDDAKIYAEKANSLYIRLSKAKEKEKIHHRRVQQEKQRLLKEVDKLTKVYEQDKLVYNELKNKYDECIEKTLILETDLKGMHAKLSGMKEIEERCRKTLEDLKKQKDRNI